MPRKFTNLRKGKDSSSESESDSESSYSDSSEEYSESESCYESESSFVETETSSSEESVHNKRRKSKKSKQIVVSESEDEDEDEDDSEYETGSEEIDKKMSKKEYTKFLSKMFPSKYAKNKAAEEESDESSEESEKKKKSTKKNKNKTKKTKKSKKEKKSGKSKSSKKDKKKVESESSEPEESETEDASSSSSADSSSDGGKNGKINILLVSAEEEDLDKEYSDYFGKYNDEDDDSGDEECNTDDEETFMKGKFEKVEEPIITEKDKKRVAKKTAEKEKKKKESEKIAMSEDVENQYIKLLEQKKDLSKMLTKSPNSKILKKAISECKREIRNLVKTARKKNTKEFHKLISNDSSRPNEFSYFKKKLSNSEQLKIMKDLKEINGINNMDKPYRLALLEADIPPQTKAVIMNKVNTLSMMEPGESEYFKLKHWVDNALKIPFNKDKKLQISMADGIDACTDFMRNAKKSLDECVFGLEDAKMQIMQMAGQMLANPGAIGSSIALCGPPGTGKTSLIKNGISKILGREFAFISLGGCSDSSYLDGHSYTYEGSMCGLIAKTLIEKQCSNCLFMFDELDKISDTPKGQEIVNLLVHLTDTTQNMDFRDKYFSEVPLDLSKCMFVFSYNDESMVNPILKDRFYRIYTKGYSPKEKLVIARQHLLPKIREQVNFKEEDVIISDDTITYIINNKALTQDEQGVRNLKRCLEIIYTKLNLFRLTKEEDKLFSKEIAMENVVFPFNVLQKHVNILIKNEDKASHSMLMMYC